jgi:hypothetical protein
VGVSEKGRLAGRHHGREVCEWQRQEEEVDKAVSLCLFQQECKSTAFVLLVVFFYTHPLLSLHQQIEVNHILRNVFDRYTTQFAPAQKHRHIQVSVRERVCGREEGRGHAHTLGEKRKEKNHITTLPPPPPPPAGVRGAGE